VPLYVTRSLRAYQRARFSVTLIHVLMALTLRSVVESSGRGLSAVWSHYVQLGHSLVLFCFNFIFTSRCAHSYRSLLHRHCRNYKLELIKFSGVQGFWPVESSNSRLGGVYNAASYLVLYLLSASVGTVDLVTLKFQANKHPPLPRYDTQ